MTTPAQSKRTVATRGSLPAPAPLPVCFAKRTQFASREADLVDVDALGGRWPNNGVLGGRTRQFDAGRLPWYTITGPRCGSRCSMAGGLIRDY